MLNVPVQSYAQDGSRTIRRGQFGATIWRWTIRRGQFGATIRRGQYGAIYNINVIENPAFIQQYSFRQSRFHLSNILFINITSNSATIICLKIYIVLFGYSL